MSFLALPSSRQFRTLLGDHVGIGTERTQSPVFLPKARFLPADEVATLASQMLGELAESEIAHHVGRVRQTPPSSKSGDEHVLTEREREVLQLVAEGLSSKAIGRHLFISSRTVSQHLMSIFNKLSVNTRAQAVAVAARRGLI